MAMGKQALGQGSNKKIAKHNAAASLLQELGEKINYTPNAGEETQNCILQLLDYCIAHNWPIPEFTEIQATGPSHCPEFTVRCQISSLVREAKANSKKLAKGKVATMMMDVIKEMQMNHPEKLKIMEVNQAMEVDEEVDENVIKTYRQYKKAEIKKQPGVRLRDRHNFFMNLDENLVAKAQKNLNDEQECIQDRIQTALIALNLKFKVEEVQSYGSPLMVFDLLHDQYDCYFISFKDSFWQDLYNHLQIMLR